MANTSTLSVPPSASGHSERSEESRRETQPNVILSEAKNPDVKRNKRHPARSRRQPTEN
jgi:hypothetical protein